MIVGVHLSLPVGNCLAAGLGESIDLIRTIRGMHCISLTSFGTKVLFGDEIQCDCERGLSR